MPAELEFERIGKLQLMTIPVEGVKVKMKRHFCGYIEQLRI